MSCLSYRDVILPTDYTPVVFTFVEICAFRLTAYDIRLT